MAVLSNLGTLGRGVLKICLSRRVDPQDEIRRLNDAGATPFPYEASLIVTSDDAVGLLRQLHRDLHDCRVNRVDLGRDFFRTDVQWVWQLATAHHGPVDCPTDAPAAEFRESAAMSDDEFRRATQARRERQAWGDEAGTR